jgi:hypothetical protein
MAIYEGKVKIRLHPVKGITLSKGGEDAKFTASDADAILDTMVKAADQHNCGIDRWALYIPELAAKMSDADKQVSVANVKAYMDGSREPVLTRGKYDPRIVLASPVKVVKQSKIIDIA